MTKQLCYICVLGVGLLTQACTSDKGAVILQEAACNTPAVVSFSTDIQPLLKQNCNTAGCHSGGSPAGNLSLETTKAYAELTNPHKGYIDTLNPTASLLYVQMSSAGDIMPPSGRLSNCSLQLVMTWIKQKAPNN